MLRDLWQHLPEHINPVVFSVESFSVRWYSLMYLVGFAVVYLLLNFRIKKKENSFAIDKNQLVDLFIYLIIGLLVGARLGYVFLYDFNYYAERVWEIFLPIQAVSQGLEITGYYGLSYHGGLLGVLIAGYVFVKKRKMKFLRLADFVVPAVPAGYFFGRIGNFLNGELYGRITDAPWGMYFSNDYSRALRHPSQLYEAFFEGIILFLILWFLRNKKKFFSVFGKHVEEKSGEGQIFFLYIFLYSLFRFFIEFFREPDEQIGFVLSWLTMGQILSLTIIILSLIWWVWQKSKKLIT